MGFILFCIGHWDPNQGKAGNTLKRIYKWETGIQLLQISCLRCNDITQSLNDTILYGKSEMKEWVYLSLWKAHLACVLFLIIDKGKEEREKYKETHFLVEITKGQKQGERQGTQDIVLWWDWSCGVLLGPRWAEHRKEPPGSLGTWTHSQVSFRAGVPWRQQGFCHGKTNAE